MYDQKKELRWSTLRVGLVITIGLFVLLVAIFFAGGIERIFSPQAQIKVEFRDVRGLRKGSPVWLFGTEVGSVKTIHLDPLYGTMVTISVNKNALHFLKKDSHATILTMGLLGDKYIELSPGSLKEEPFQPGEIIQGKEEIEFSQIMNTAAEAVGKIGDFISKLDAIVEKIDKGQGTVTKFFTDPSVYDNLKKSTQTLSQFLDEIKNSEGSLKMLVKDPALYNNLHQASSRLSSILEGIDQGKGMAGALVRNEELPKDLQDTLRELKKLTADLDALAKDIKENPKKYFKFSVF